jgi:hypothetical protein
MALNVFYFGGGGLQPYRLPVADVIIIGSGSLDKGVSVPRTLRGNRLGGVMVSVPATGPKVRGFEPGQGDGFLRAIKIRSTPYLRMGSKAGRSHAVRSLEAPRGRKD